MKSTGMTRELDGLGRVVIPQELRDTLDIRNADPVMFLVGGNEIGIKKYIPGCLFCGELESTMQVRGYKVCEGCRKELHTLVVRNSSSKIRI